MVFCTSGLYVLIPSRFPFYVLLVLSISGYTMYNIDINLGRYQILGSVSIYTATFLSVIQVAVCPQAIYAGNHAFRYDKHKVNYQTSRE